MRGVQRLASVSTLQGYRWRNLRHDGPAGLALTALLLPQGIAYARLAGLPPVTGLYTTIACLTAYALIGPSRLLIVGPDSAVSPLVFAAIVPLVSTDDPAAAVALAGMLGLLVGGLEVLLGIGRVGFVATLLSKPVRIGFLNGLALVIIVSQLPALCGFSNGNDGALGAAGAFVRHLDEFDPWAFAFGAGTVLVMLAVRHWWPRVPGVLLAVVAATVANVVFDGAGHGVPVLGTLPQGLPDLTLPWVPVDDLVPLMTAAVGIVLISLADTIAVSSTLAGVTGDEVDPDREIVAIGGANLMAGLFQGFPVSASATRSAVARDAGARTQMVGLVGAVGVTTLLVATPGLLAEMPLSALAAVIIVAAAGLVDVATLRRLSRARPTSLVLALVATLGVVVLGVLPGVGVAVALSVVFYFRRGWWPEAAALGRVPGLRGWHSVARYPDARTIVGVVVFRWDAPLFFANASLFHERVRTMILQTDPRPHHVVIECSAVTDIDVTAADMLVSLDRELAEHGVTLVFADLRDRLRELLSDYRVAGGIDEGPFYRSIKEALEAITGEDLEDLGLG